MSPLRSVSDQLAIHARTPALVVSDPRGLAVRTLGYYRREAGTPAEPRVSAQWHDHAGRPVAQWDPRQFAHFQSGVSETPNQATVFSFSDTPLLQRNADSGWKAMLLDAQGSNRESWDSKGIHTTLHYDQHARLVSVAKRDAEGRQRITQRVDYAPVDSEHAARNLCGTSYRHDDDAGSRIAHGFDINGEAISYTQHFLSAEVPPDWPALLVERDALLEPGPGYRTAYTHDATGMLVTHKDALGNAQHFGHDISGLEASSRLVTAEGLDCALLSAVIHDAGGRVVSQTMGSGVTSRAEYDPINQRLLRAMSVRADAAVLQDLHYLYDPAGNIIKVSDQSQPTRYHANRRIEAINEYRYDSFCQLIEATGREAANAGDEGPSLPPLLVMPQDPSLLLNYRQNMEYDRAGNLTELRHVNGQRNRTLRMAVANASNRSLPERDGQLPDEGHLTDGFDANGNTRELLPGQALTWDEYNQLQRVAPVQRDDEEDDYERYIYDAAGSRLRKISHAQQRSGSRRCEVRYLPGLEIRTDSRSGERLHVIVAQAGKNGVRLLHWAHGKPEGLPNDQLRFTLSNHLRSATLELGSDGQLLSREEYYPFGGTACWAGRSALQAKYKTIRYSGKERDATGLYYYGLRYYAPWLMRWINPDPAGDIDGLNLYAMVGNNPISLVDGDGRAKTKYDTLEAMIEAGPTDEYLAGQPYWGRGSEQERRRKYENWKDHCKTWFNRARHSRAEVLLAAYEIAETNSKGVIQALKNMESNTELAKSVGLRGATIVVSNLSSTATGTAIGAAVGAMTLGPAGALAGAGLGMVVGKLASIVSEKAMEKAGNTATLHLRTGSLGASSIMHDAKIRKNGLPGKVFYKARSYVPDNPKNALNLSTEAVKTAGSKAAGPAGVVVKIGVDAIKAGYEVYKTQQEKDPAKLECLESSADGAIAELYRRTLQVAAMYGATADDDELPGLTDGFLSGKNMTLRDLAAKFGAAVDHLQTAAAATSAFRQRHQADLITL
ncbi:RHS repeat protein [Pseudomonas sp. CFBP 8770]|uniref:RHS repeat domain-containing protein n=1 Tax=unclassified Pseudomonas TaxID=196821 RepID=UPI001782FFA4|nr:MULTISPECIES: RHS repeat protein [unclassified Pseudomonas]MBD8476239.1 RHS repeat protein [Pseudomonas sp. CFBP 8773]MBD8649021.1 RHS repeat protein [Pseudomonas sp. CFBP 8770]